MHQSSKSNIQVRVGVQLVEEHGLEAGDKPGHKLTVGRLKVNQFNIVEGSLPGTFIEGVTTALGDRVGGLGTTIAYPVYRFTEGELYCWQHVEFVQKDDGTVCAEGKWRWNGGTGAFSKLCGEGSVDVKVIQEAGAQPRRVLDYTGVYWFE